MKNILLNSAFLILPVFVISQVGIGTTTPETGSVLDVVSADKGILIPRLQLTGINDMATVQVTAEDAGIVVYNLENAGQAPADVHKDTYYVWDGSNWEDISTLDDARTVIQENNVSTTLFVGRPAAVVTANASAAYTAWTTVDFANESLDRQNIHNSGIFTIPETGLYAFSGGINMGRSNNSGANKYFGGRIIHNGTEVVTSMFGTSAGGGGGFIPLYWNAWLNAGDVIQIQYRMRDSTATGTFTLNTDTNISVIKNSN
ncbi:hypothetical protein [Chryseobacterium sp.]|uniref:hypothetical protein n=1 Tax=Chryseobacterium sp. TaxID=1871047 RepID=UPI0025C45D8A|nr:hypothetical protein [Chryseobacterium sp.]MBV8326520.1 hypothetical protein [Chryseobacterium sp.]